MFNVFIFHGTAGYPEENWFPWLKQKLEEQGWQVTVPKFPTPENQSPETWFKVLEKYQNHINENTILIGHSLGGTFLLRVLEKLNKPVRAAFFVASPVGVLPIKNIATDRPFLEKPFNWQRIRANALKFAVYHSDNDPYVCMENGQELAKNLQVQLNFVAGAGHFNKAAGYTSFDLLLEKLTTS